MTWNNINFKHRFVPVEVGDAKTGETRSVPMTLRLTTTWKLLRIATSEPLCLNSEGKPYWNVTTALNSAVKRVGIKNLTIYDLRHTFASR